jgi:hypothetical protein
MPPQTLFSLNMRNITNLFPGFAPGDFAVLHGSSSILSLTSLLCVRAQLPTQLGGLSSHVVFVDGGNTFRLYQISRLAQLHQLNPRTVLERIHISRAFTAYQMAALLMEKLEEAVERYDAKLVVVSDIAGFFLDKGILEDEARSLFSQATAYLSRFVKEKQLVLIATYPPHQNTSRNLFLHALSCGRANTVISLTQTKYDRDFVLEKHPRYVLGSAAFPSENLTLTDFTEGLNSGKNG